MSEEKMNEKIDLTGHWFVHFGVDLEAAKIEGSRILTLNGGFDPDNLIDILCKHIQDSLPQEAKDIIERSGQRIVIRSFNRIDPLLNIGGQTK